MFTTQAKNVATRAHEGQLRKQGQIPYITHPHEVVGILKRQGYNAPSTIAAAWLHDTIEDTLITYDNIKEIFGVRVADCVYVLTRNIERDMYKKRVVGSVEEIQAIKIADTIHNTETPGCLSQKGLLRKIRDSEECYIPLAQHICPAMASELERNIERCKGYLTR